MISTTFFIIYFGAPILLIGFLLKIDWGDFLKLQERRVSYLVVGAVFTALLLWTLHAQDKAQKQADVIKNCNANSICTDSAAALKSHEQGIVVRSVNGNSYFNGDRCYQGCAGHIAGFKWAEQQIISKTGRLNHPDDCTGNSQSFIVGCRTYMFDILRIGEDEKDQGYESDRFGR